MKLLEQKGCDLEQQVSYKKKRRMISHLIVYPECSEL